MKKSLELLLTSNEGRILAFNEGGTALSDDIVYTKAKRITNKKEKEEFLLKYIEKAPHLFIRSSAYLIELIKKHNPQYAYDLASLLCRSLITDPSPYWLIAEISIDHKAWFIAKNALEIAKWLSFDKYKHAIDKTNKLLNFVLNKIKNKETDNSYKAFWKDKLIDKLKVLVKLYYSLDEETLTNYSLHLLDTFPLELENYEKVLEIIALIDDKNTTKRFINYIQENKYIGTENKNLFLGISHYVLNDYDNSIKYLMACLNTNNNLKAKFYLSLNHLVKNHKSEFITYFKEFTSFDLKNTNLILENFETLAPTTQAVFLIYLIFEKTKIDFKELKQEVGFEISKIINKILKYGLNKEVDYLIKQFNEFNYFSFIPSLGPYLAEIFIRVTEFEKAKELIKDSKNKESHRILAWIYRLEGKEDKAEEELIKYRSEWKPYSPIPQVHKMIDLDLPKEILSNKEEKILNLLKEAYTKTLEVKKGLQMEYGINGNTCIESNCMECCKKTFPYISYTEYLYLKKWLDKQPEDLKKQIQENSIKVVNQYREKYKKDPLFLDANELDLHKYYPKDFKFDCPCLGEKGCNVFEAEPFTCRAYGYSSGDRVQIMACNYFSEQFKAASTLSPVRKVIDMFSFTSFSKLTDKMLIETSVIAPIPVWFSQSHEETVWKAKYHILSKSIFKPVFNFITNLYKKKIETKRTREYHQ